MLLSELDDVNNRLASTTVELYSTVHTVGARFRPIEPLIACPCLACTHGTFKNTVVKLRTGRVRYYSNVVLYRENKDSFL